MRHLGRPQPEIVVAVLGRVVVAVGRPGVDGGVVEATAAVDPVTGAF